MGTTFRNTALHGSGGRSGKGSSHTLCHPRDIAQRPWGSAGRRLLLGTELRQSSTRELPAAGVEAATELRVMSGCLEGAHGTNPPAARKNWERENGRPGSTSGMEAMERKETFLSKEDSAG